MHDGLSESALPEPLANRVLGTEMQADAATGGKSQAMNEGIDKTGHRVPFEIGVQVRHIDPVGIGGKHGGQPVPEPFYGGKIEIVDQSLGNHQGLAAMIQLAQEDGIQSFPVPVC